MKPTTCNHDHTKARESSVGVCVLDGGGVYTRPCVHYLILGQISLRAMLCIYDISPLIRFLLLLYTPSTLLP
jgi:hypothetical protein